MLAYKTVENIVEALIWEVIIKDAKKIDEFLVGFKAVLFRKGDRVMDSKDSREESVSDIDLDELQDDPVSA